MADLKFNNKGLKDFLAVLNSNIHVKVGLLSRVDSDISEIGLNHEIGKPENNLPQRSFLRMPLQLQKRKLTNKIPAVKRVKDIKKVFTTLGVNAVAVIQEAFETGGFGNWQKLSEYTINKKGFDTILIETGRLRRSISFEVIEND